MGDALGESQQKMSVLLKLCQGKVLVIDEAYVLDADQYGEEVLNTLVEKVMGDPGEDIAVIMCGYEREMHRMLRNQNPGLRRRFNPDNQFVFEDFSDQQLLMIMKSAIANEGLQVDLTTLVEAVSEISKKRAMPHFGNAGAVNSMISSAKIRLASRVFNAKETGTPVTHPNNLIREDLLGEDADRPEDPFSILEDLNNTKSIIEHASVLSGCSGLEERRGTETIGGQFPISWKARHRKNDHCQRDGTDLSKYWGVGQWPR